jgi:hypothetical protein
VGKARETIVRSDHEDRSRAADAAETGSTDRDRGRTMHINVASTAHELSTSGRPDRWPGAVRVVVALGLAAAAWIAVVALVRALADMG